MAPLGSARRQDETTDVLPHDFELCWDGAWCATTRTPQPLIYDVAQGGDEADETGLHFGLICMRVISKAASLAQSLKLSEHVPTSKCVYMSALTTSPSVGVDELAGRLHPVDDIIHGLTTRKSLAMQTSYLQILAATPKLLDLAGVNLTH